MTTIEKKTGISATKSIRSKTTPTTDKPVKKEPLARKAPPKKKVPVKNQPTGTKTEEPVAKDQSTGTKTTRKPKTKKNPKTKATPFKPTLMFTFDTLQGMGIAQGYLRGAGLNYKSGKAEDGRPAIQIEGTGSMNKKMITSFRGHLKNHRIKYEEDKL